MKIIILGASGFLGFYLKNYLKKKRIKIITCGRNNSNNIKIKNYTKNNLSKIILKNLPNVIINLVAITNVDQCEKNKKVSNKINTDISKSLYEILKKYKIDTKLIYISTDQVYDGIGKKNEKNVRLFNQYSKSKYNAENYIIKSSGCVLRTNFFGKLKNKNTLVDWIIESVKSKKLITVFNNIYFSPVYVKTLCKYIYYFCKNKSKGVYNVGSKNCISKSQFAFYIIKKLKLNQKYLLESNYLKKTLIAKRPKNMCMDSTKFSRSFNVKIRNCYHELNLMIKDLT